MPGDGTPEQTSLNPELWFSTPIWGRQLSDYQRINSEILNVLRVLEAEQQHESIARSNIGGWHSHTKLHQRKDMSEITQVIAAGCVGCARSMNFDFNLFDLSITDMWLNRNGPGNLNKPHVHPHSMLSGVYYVQVPLNSGNLEFYDPVTARVVSTYPIEKRKQTNPSSIELVPQEGKLVIFPSWLQHWVQPNMGSGDRVSISFNVGYQPKSS